MTANDETYSSTVSGSDSFSSDWRVDLFGSHIQLNPKDAEVDEERPASFIPTEKAFDSSRYDYIAIFMGADYCPHCKAFAPTVNSSASALEAKRCKVIFVSNDRTEEAFQASCKKNAGLDVMPYDLQKTRAMRDLFGLETIPALMILKNDNFTAKNPTVVTNARHSLVADPTTVHFPWAPVVSDNKREPISKMDRFLIRGKYGKWWEMGHHVNPNKPDQVYMDEHAVRIRAGFLNIISWIALINIFFWREPIFVKILFPLVSFEFLVSAHLGLTPIAPLGTLATLVAMVLQPEPYWKPAKPKRFAWYIGLSIATSCLLFFIFRVELGNAYRPLIGLTVSICNLATWLEGAGGFCLGCFVYNTWMVPFFKLEECSECKL